LIFDPPEGYNQRMQFHPNDLSDLDELTEEHLGFSALSDGLGFSKGKQGPHPATKKGMEPAARKEPEMDLDEEDLAQLSPSPAAQEKSRKMSLSGIGAVAAGPMRPAPSFNAPFAPTAAPATSSAKPKAAAAPSASTSAAKVLAEPAAARWRRTAAFVLDSLFVSLPLALAWVLSFGHESREIFLQDPRLPLGLFAVIFAAYFLLSESFGGQSLGKMALGLRVVEDDKYQKPTGLKHAVVRLLLLVPGTLLFGIGLIASFWDAKRRPWHDRYSNSIVRRTA
jgi:uncharacterized RDD family membrane protein YckC